MSRLLPGRGIACALSLALACPGAIGGFFEALETTSQFKGCGCTFGTAGAAEGERAVLFSSDYAGSARIETAGHVVTLEALRPDRACRPAEVGEQCVLEYRQGDVHVVVDVRADWVCPEEEESCEVVRLRGTLSGRTSSVESTVDVDGDCGC